MLANSDYVELITGDIYVHKTYNMGMVDANNCTNFYDGKIRVTSPGGKEHAKYDCAAVSRVHCRAGRALVLPEVPLPEEDRLEGACRRRGLGRVQGHAAVALQRGRRHGHAAGPGRVQADVRNARRQADPPHAGHALGPAGRVALRDRAVGRIGHRSADHRQGIPRAAHARRRPTASAASRPRAARSRTTTRPTSAAF